MAEASPLSPHELDRVEDALEGLEGAPGIDDASPAVQRMLEDYQQILVASREALPMVDVPAGVLDTVLAQARDAVEADVLGVTDAVPKPKRTSFWARLSRGFMIPGLAVAGTAALVLLLVRPTMRDASVVAQNEDAPAGRSVSEKSRTIAVDGNAEAPRAEAPAEALARADEAAAAAAAEEELVEIATSRRSAKQKVPVSSGMPTTPAAAPTPRPEPSGQAKDSPADAGEAEPGADEDRAANWEAIEKGDKARKNGDCFAARNAYRRALDDGNDSVRARAHAGIGLCEIEEGDSDAATLHFDQAELLDAEVKNYISTQSSDSGKPSPKAKRKRSKKRKAAPMRNGKNDYGEVQSPFGD